MIYFQIRVGESAAPTLVARLRYPEDPLPNVLGAVFGTLIALAVTLVIIIFTCRHRRRREKTGYSQTDFDHMIELPELPVLPQERGHRSNRDRPDNTPHTRQFKSNNWGMIKSGVTKDIPGPRLALYPSSYRRKEYPTQESNTRKSNNRYSGNFDIDNVYFEPTEPDYSPRFQESVLVDTKAYQDSLLSRPIARETRYAYSTDSFKNRTQVRDTTLDANSGNRLQYSDARVTHNPLFDGGLEAASPPAQSRKRHKIQGVRVFPQEWTKHKSQLQVDEDIFGRHLSKGTGFDDFDSPGY